jgi:hypothetical protein
MKYFIFRGQIQFSLSFWGGSKTISRQCSFFVTASIGGRRRPYLFSIFLVFSAASFCCPFSIVKETDSMQIDFRPLHQTM